MYWYNMIPTINKPTKEGKNSATAIAHIITNCIVTCQFKTAILRTKVIDIFLLLWLWEQTNLLIKANRSEIFTNVTTMKRPSNHLNSDFEKLSDGSLKNAMILMKDINIFFETFLLVDDHFFPKVKVRKIKKCLHSPWIRKGIAKFSKRKQNLYEKYLERKTT